MNPIPLSPGELSSVRPGEALTLATVLLVFTVIILAICAYKLFASKGGKITLPGGYKFEWTSALF